MLPHFSLKQPLTRTTLLLTASFLIVMATLGVTALAWLSSEHDTEPASAPAVEQSAPASQSLEGERIMITPAGFEPSEIIRPRGRFLLMVDNRSGLHELTLRLTINGQHVREKRFVPGALNWSEILDLPSGTYTVTEADHPDWLLRLTITGQ